MTRGQPEKNNGKRLATQQSVNGAIKRTEKGARLFFNGLRQRYTMLNGSLSVLFTREGIGIDDQRC